MNTIVVILLGTVMVFGVAGCEARSGSGAIRFALHSAPVTLDPRRATDATSSRINRLLYRRLVEFDEAYHPIPALAEWTKISPTHYRFVLGGQGRRFHNGTRLTAQDVKATYESVLAPDSVSPHRGSIKHIARIEVVDADTVDFYLERADRLFPGRLVVGILPAELIAKGHPFGQRPVGSGPFAFEGWPEEGRLHLRRRRDGQRFEFVEVADPITRVLKLERGEVDLLQNNLPRELLGYLERQEGIRVERARGTNFAYIGFNLDDPLTGRLAVRKAVAYAVDRRALIRYLLLDTARPAAGLLPRDHWAGADSLQGYEYDPQRARELLRQAGFGPDNPARLTYKTSNDPLRVRIATAIQHQLGRVGIDVELRTYDWNTYFSDIKAGAFQMYTLQWVGIKLPDIFDYAFHSASTPPKGANRGRYDSAKADRLIETARAASSRPRQAELYRRLQRLLLEDLPYVPLWYENHYYAARSTIGGYRLAPDGNFDALEDVARRGQARDAMTATSGEAAPSHE